jgi:hypothetical protein
MTELGDQQICVKTNIGYIPFKAKWESADGKTKLWLCEDDHLFINTKQLEDEPDPEDGEKTIQVEKPLTGRIGVKHFAKTTREQNFVLDAPEGPYKEGQLEVREKYLASLKPVQAVLPEAPKL